MLATAAPAAVPTNVLRVTFILFLLLLLPGTAKRVVLRVPEPIVAGIGTFS
jgi:hypothetical protein